MIRDIVTRGFGNGTYSGTIPLVVTRGYAIGEEEEVVVVATQFLEYTANLRNLDYTCAYRNLDYTAPQGR